MDRCHSKMPKKHQTIKVIKVPLRKAQLDKPQVFPRMPRLYLELIENKAKIKQDLINQEYVPEVNSSHFSSSDKNINNTQLNNKNSSLTIDNKEYHKSSSQKGDFENRLDLLLSDNNNEESDYSSDNEKNNRNNENVSPSILSTTSSISDLSIKENKIHEGYSSSNSEDLSERLKELLNEDSNSEASFSIKEKKLDKNRGKYSSSRDKFSKNSEKYSRHRDKDGHTVHNSNDYGSAPTLSELEKQGGYVPKRELRDINSSTVHENQEDDAKRELLFKFDLLRKSYPASAIAEYSIHTELNTMQKSYNDTVRRLSLDSSVENYKTYLVYGFMGCEFIFGNFLGFDMQGFTQQQIVSMNSYEKLLIELGEKSYVPSGSKWPIELRLLFMIIMNAAFFIVSKMLMKKTGANLMGMVNSMNSRQTQPNTTSSSTARKRRMRGPNIDIGDIPDISNTE